MRFRRRSHLRPERMVGLLVAIAAAFAPAAWGRDGTVLQSPPEHPDPSVRWVFYLHGRIIEEAGIRPTHPDFGVYEYEEILSLLAGRGFWMVSEARPSGTRPDDYAEKIATQVRALLRAGVPAERITVMGFSKGGVIAILAASILKERDVNFVFLASCGAWLERPEGPTIHGRALSIYEESDEIGRSCEPLFRRSDSHLQHDEVRIATGDRHGAFYRPREEWLTPAVAWIEEPPDRSNDRPPRDR